jgi:hypothetical protein
MEKGQIEYKMDLSKTERAGDFKCPNCRVTISPDDQTESVYSIRDTITVRNTLVELLIQCNKCMNLIHLTGFNVGSVTLPQRMKKHSPRKKTTINVKTLPPIGVRA